MARRRDAGPGSRELLIEAARRLLAERGATAMSVDAVVTRAGLSTGTFFHFFPTKRRFLEALCDRLADASWEATAAALDTADADPVARLDLLLAGVRRWRSERSQALGVLWRELVLPENAELSALVVTRWSERFGGVLVALIEDGVAAGAMRVADPQVTGPLVAEWVAAGTLGSLRLVMERPGPDAVRLAVRRTDATVASIERVLGLAEGRLTRADPAVVTSLAAALRDPPASPGHAGHGTRPEPSRRNP